MKFNWKIEDPFPQVSSTIVIIMVIIVVVIEKNGIFWNIDPHLNIIIIIIFVLFGFCLEDWMVFVIIIIMMLIHEWRRCWLIGWLDGNIVQM